MKEEPMEQPVLASSVRQEGPRVKLAAHTTETRNKTKQILRRTVRLQRPRVLLLLLLFFFFSWSAKLVPAFRRFVFGSRARVYVEAARLQQFTLVFQRPSCLFSWAQLACAQVRDSHCLASWRASGENGARRPRFNAPHRLVSPANADS
jgi:hypothetical protein